MVTIVVLGPTFLELKAMATKMKFGNGEHEMKIRVIYALVDISSPQSHLIPSPFFDWKGN